MGQTLTLNQMVQQHKEGTMDYNAPWYDWFCKSTSLVSKGKKLMGRVNAISSSKKFDGDKTYIWFKNNYPCYGDGRLYDDFRIADIETQNTLYTIIPRNPYGEAEVWGKENNFSAPLIKGTWKEIKEFFLKG